nr:hypothetical protein [Janthinobacterium psychrotolerans]
MEQHLAVARDIDGDGLATLAHFLDDPQADGQRGVAVEAVELQGCFLLRQGVEQIGVVIHVSSCRVVVNATVTDATPFFTAR